MGGAVSHSSFLHFPWEEAACTLHPASEVSSLSLMKTTGTKSPEKVQTAPKGAPSRLRRSIKIREKRTCFCWHVLSKEFNLKILARMRNKI